MPNTDKIEREAVRAVEGYLDKCPKLKPIINSNDKTPIWDGDIYVYINDNQKTENFFARVPLQVKGTTIAEENTYRINREYLDGFKAERGTAFFMVKEDGNTSQVFYALLTSEHLNTLLQNTAQTINIPLQEVPEDPNVFEQELYTFAANRNSEKVEQTSPKEIQKLVKGFEGLRGHLKEIKDKSARIELEGLLDNIKNLKDESAKEKGTIGWRDKFYFFSRKAIELAINNIKGDNFAELQFNLGKYLYDQKQYHLVEDYYLNALKECYNRSDIVNAVITLNNLGNLHSNLTRYDEAEKEYMATLIIFRELVKTNRDAFIGYVAAILNNLGNLHTNLTRYDEAEKEFNKALEIRRELAKTNRAAYIENVAETLNNLAVLHWTRTRYNEAEKEYEEALKIRRELAKTNRDAYIGKVADTLNNIAALHYVLKCYDEAEKEYDEALEIYRELSKTNRDAYIFNMATNLFNIALTQEATDRKAEALKTAEKALAIYKELAQDHPQIWNEYVEKTERLLEDISNNS